MQDYCKFVRSTELQNTPLIAVQREVYNSNRIKIKTKTWSKEQKNLLSSEGLLSGESIPGKAAATRRNNYTNNKPC